MKHLENRHLIKQASCSFASFFLSCFAMKLFSFWRRKLLTPSFPSTNDLFHWLPSFSGVFAGTMVLNRNQHGAVGFFFFNSVNLFFSMDGGRSSIRSLFQYWKMFYMATLKSTWNDQKYHQSGSPPCEEIESCSFAGYKNTAFFPSSFLWLYIFSPRFSVFFSICLVGRSLCHSSLY